MYVIRLTFETSIIQFLRTRRCFIVLHYDCVEKKVRKWTIEKVLVYLCESHPIPLLEAQS